MSVSEKQIKDWKKEHGAVYALPVDDKTAYLRKPFMSDYKRGFSALQNQGDVAFSEEMLSVLFIGGDEEIKTDDAYFLAAKKDLLALAKYEDAVITPGENNRTIISIGDAKCTVRVVTRDDLKMADLKNPGNKPFVTQEKLFDLICENKDEVFNDKNNAEIRFPLYKAIEDLQNQKVSYLKKL